MCFSVIFPVAFLLPQEDPLRNILLQNKCTDTQCVNMVMGQFSSPCLQSAHRKPSRWPGVAKVCPSGVFSLAATAKFLCSCVLSAGLLLRPRWWAWVGMASGSWSSPNGPFRPLAPSLFLKLCQVPFPSSYPLISSRCIICKNFVHTVQWHGQH